MARQQITVYIDDFTGEPGEDVVEVKWVVGDTLYEMDMSESTRKQFDEALAPFLAKGRKGGTFRLDRVLAGRTPVATTRPTVDREQNQAVREWAAKRGIKVSDRGRIPASVLEQFHQEH